ncbi:MAG: phenazine biosynthesis protein PhzF [Maritimibacter sp.]|nr:phenazine biosynthesis protein PhzF [Maritimibacter sp.]
MPMDFDWVDAFTAVPFGGNGCAVVYDEGGLDPETCMTFVRETGLVECTFIGPSDAADVKIRYFMNNMEIPFAGHPTLASVASLADRGRAKPGLLRCETGAGVIPVEIETTADGPRITMTQVAPVFGDTMDPALVAAAGGLSADDIVGTPQVVSTGLPFVIAVVKEKECLRRLSPDFDAMRMVRGTHDTLEPFWVSLGGETEAGDTFSRLVLAPPLPPEDPFTGSATGAMASYLWHHGLIDSPRFVAEQGHWMGRPGRADVEVLGPRDAIEGVRVGGRGHVLMRGYLNL